MSYATLIVEDEATLAKNMKVYLERYGYDVRIAGSGEEGLKQLDEFLPEVVILDFNLPGIDGLQTLARICERDPRIKVIIITGHGSEQVAVDAMKAGAHDYLTKPLVLGKLKMVLDKAVGQDRLEEELSYYRKKAASDSGLDKMLGNSPPMRALKDMLRQLARAEAGLKDRDPPAVLINGETGTGKELVARALHFDGVRRTHPFVEVNCSTIPGPLLEAELFGYERGAFTDAKERKLGLIEAAEGGTLFLDEIGDLDLSVQVKLLKLLEDKMVRRLGSVREHKVNVRIIAATNKALEQLVRDGKLRSDLFFRLRVVHIELPPLRTRGDDIRMLAEHVLHLQATRYGKPKLIFTTAAMQLLLSYAWPGNVRELRNVIEQSVIMSHGDAIDVGDLSFHRTIVEESTEPVAAPQWMLTQPTPTDLGFNLPDLERRLVNDALRQTAWNVTKAAKLLGLSRDTLRYRMEKFNLSRPS